MGQVRSNLRERVHAAMAEGMLDSAERAMTRLGYEKATMQAIAGEAGCATGTLYLYFPNKQELFQAIVARHGEAIFREANERAVGAAGPMERLRAVFEAILSYGQSHQAFFQLVFLAIPTRSLRARLHEISGPAEEGLSGIVERELALAQRQGLVRRDLPLSALREFMDVVTMSMVEQFSFAPSAGSVEERLRVLWGLLTGGLKHSE
jgi:AcrR family transcriptional regulator